MALLVLASQHGASPTSLPGERTPAGVSGQPPVTGHCPLATVHWTPLAVSRLHPPASKSK